MYGSSSVRQGKLARYNNVESYDGSDINLQGGAYKQHTVALLKLLK